MFFLGKQNRATFSETSIEDVESYTDVALKYKKGDVVIICDTGKMGMIISDSSVLKNEIEYQIVKTKDNDGVQIDETNLILLKDWLRQKVMETSCLEEELGMYWKKLKDIDFGNNLFSYR